MIENSYNDFLRETILSLFPKKEALLFMEESDKKRPLTIRLNKLLTTKKELTKKLSSRGMDIENVEWCDDALVVFSSSVPVGATPEYLAGHYIIQGASSMLSVLNLNIKDNLLVLDMCSAPGGKSQYISALMNNTGVLFCNDINEERVLSLRSNLLRMNTQNAIVLNMDARRLCLPLVDRVLLDAPCSGTGVISKDQSIKMNRTESDLRKTVFRQKELILKGFDTLKKGGIMIYSTCSVLVKENEEVVTYLLSKRVNARVVECEVDVGRPGFPTFRGVAYHPSMSLTRRIYPHVHNMDGFYYAKIEKQ
ncbi:NOL1/NOP2/Sun family protein [Vairimorpha necatrix]|uniref:NOL1/NOP2/Sun family protein n=1 Tax=Vairimorpha necatrix TaxID=6039 RepID=A0AAX4J9Q8_9MICR